MHRSNSDEWWPLHVAIGWVHTRNELVVRELLEGKWLPILLARESISALEQYPKQIRIYYQNILEARRQLETAIRLGRIQTVGSYFIKRVVSDDISIYNSKESEEIQPYKLRNLNIYEDVSVEHANLILCLISQDARIARGAKWNNLRGYHNIEVNVADLKRWFPVSGCAGKALSSAQKKRASDAQIDRFIKEYLRRDPQPSQLGAWKKARNELSPNPTRGQVIKKYKALTPHRPARGRPPKFAEK